MGQSVFSGGGLVNPGRFWLSPHHAEVGLWGRYHELSSRHARKESNGRKDRRRQNGTFRGRRKESKTHGTELTKVNDGINHIGG